MDKEILGSVSGLSLEFSYNKLPHYHKGMEIRFSSKEELFLAYKIKNSLQKGVIKKSQPEEGELIFLEPKSEDSFRMILNLKRLNENIPYIHFKMETIKSIFIVSILGDT